MPGLVSPCMSDRLRAGKPPRFFYQPLRPTQPSTCSGMENEHQPNCGDALWLGSKGKYGSFHLWINVWVVKLCDPSLTCAIPECFRDDFLMVKHYTNLWLLYFTYFILKVICNGFSQNWWKVVSSCLLQYKPVCVINFDKLRSKMLKSQSLVVSLV